MGLFKRSKSSSDVVDEAGPSRPIQPKKTTIFDFLNPNKNRVSEATLQVWRNLPGEIRQDPSMINFQREAERWKGEYSIFFINAQITQLRFGNFGTT